MTSFAGKTVWITGASSGIGEALAYEMAQAGARLVLSARNESELNRVKAACTNPNLHVVLPLDLEAYDHFAELVDTTWLQHGPIDILINNAGISQRYLVADSDFSLDKRIMNTNFLGTVALTRPVLQKMRQRNSGQIAVVSSMLGLYGIQTRSAYSASKHALRGYFESLRNELFKSNITITMIYPGYINTLISNNALMADGSTFGHKDNAHQHGITPQKCAQKIIYALAKHKAQVIISGPKERFGAFMSRFFPSIFRRISPRFEV